MSKKLLRSVFQSLFCFKGVLDIVLIPTSMDFSISKFQSLFCFKGVLDSTLFFGRNYLHLRMGIGFSGQLDKIASPNTRVFLGVRFQKWSPYEPFRHWIDTRGYKVLFVNPFGFGGEWAKLPPKIYAKFTIVPFHTTSLSNITYSVKI